jgi:hypothetical protein
MPRMNTPPTPKNIRVTVPVTPDVLAMFQRLSEVAGKSVGRLMGEWLEETRDGLEPMIEIVSSFKTAPKAAVQALQLRANAVAELAQEAVSQAMKLKPDGSLGDGRRAERDGSKRSAVSIAKRGLTPPSSNTGGKGRKTAKSGTWEQTSFVVPKVASVQAYADTNGVKPKGKK